MRLELRPCSATGLGACPGAHQHAQGAGHSQASAGHDLSSTRQQASRQGWAGDGHGGRKQLWRRARSGEQLLCIALSCGGTAQAARVAQLGLTPWTWMLLPASSLPRALPSARLLGVPWASGQPWAGGSELCWPSLSLLSPTPGTILALPRLWAALRSFSALKGRQGNAEREEGEGRGHTGSSQEHSGIPGRLLCLFMWKDWGPQMFPYEDKMPVQRSPCGDPGVTLPEGSPLPISQPGCSSGAPGEGSGAVASSERLCLPPLVLAAILSSQLRAAPRGERGVSLARAAQRYQMVSRRPHFPLSCKKQIRKNLLPEHFCTDPIPRAPEEP